MVEACVENGASCIDISGEPQVGDSRKTLPYIKDLFKEYLFSMFLLMFLNMRANYAS